ncbi:glycosyltransferase [Mesorhizobium sp. KR1-2]|uniref:glycosyltransferase n=1 Tax=Mesorhizobium sp. KR1-2 TaxID=3156609 RepID=UPI0032B4F21F
MTDIQPASPVVSVVTRTLGHLPFLNRVRTCLEASTSSPAIDWIIVDDEVGGSPALDEFVSGAASTGRIKARLVKSLRRHRAKAANAGLTAAHGDFIHFLDDDDQICSDFYRHTIAALTQNERVGAAAVKCEAVMERPSLDGGSFIEISRTPHYPEVTHITLASLAATQTIPLISVLFRSDAVRKAGLFDVTFETCEDYEFLLRFLAVEDIMLLKETLASFHRRETPSDRDGNSAVTCDFATEISHFRNVMLRRDLNEGKLGLGWLLAMAELSGGSLKTEKILSQFYKYSFVNFMFSALRRR